MSDLVKGEPFWVAPRGMGQWYVDASIATLTAVLFVLHLIVINNLRQ